MIHLCGAVTQYPELKHQCVCIREYGHKERWHRCWDTEHEKHGSKNGGAWTA